jgi:hypothetical protein
MFARLMHAISNSRPTTAISANSGFANRFCRAVARPAPAGFHAKLQLAHYGVFAGPGSFFQGEPEQHRHFRARLLDRNAGPQACDQL